MSTSKVPEWRLIDRLRRSREHAGFEQADFGDLLGISRGSVSNYERGVRQPPRPVLTAWALASGVDRDWLEHGESKRTHSDDLLDEVDRALRGVELALRARRDSNPQPSDLESDARCTRCGHLKSEHYYGTFCLAYVGPADAKSWGLAA